MMENTNGNNVPYTIKFQVNKKNNQNINLNLPPEVINEEIKNPFIVPGLQKLKLILN